MPLSFIEALLGAGRKEFQREGMNSTIHEQIKPNDDKKSRPSGYARLNTPMQPMISSIFMEGEAVFEG